MYDKSTSTRLTNVILAAQSFTSTSFIAMFTLLSIVAVEISGRDAMAGVPSTVLGLSRAAAALPIGIIMGRFGRRFGLTLSYTSGAIGAFLGVIAISQGWFWLLIVSVAVVGAGRAGSDQSRFAAGDMFEEHDRARMIGRVVFAGTAGAIFGPLLVQPSVSFSETMGLLGDTGPWVLSSVFLLIAALITFTLLRPEPMEIARELDGLEKKKKVDYVDTPGRSISQMLKLPRVQLAILSMVISQSVMAILMVITPLHMKHNAHQIGAVSIVMTAHTLGMFGLSSITGRLIDRYGRVSMMVAGALTLIAATIISPLSPALPFLVVGLFLLGLGWNFAYVAGSSLLADALEGEERTRIQGTNDMLVGGAAAFASFSSGPLFGVGQYAGVAGMGFAVTLIFIWLIRILHLADKRTMLA